MLYLHCGWPRTGTSGLQEALDDHRDRDVLLSFEGYSNALLEEPGRPSAPAGTATVRHRRACAAVLLNLEALSARIGVELDPASVRRALRRNELSFSEDRPCQLFDADSRRAVHERALSAARRQEFAPYAEFFGDDQIGRAPTVDLSPEVLDDDDLARLTTIGKVPA